MFSDRIRYVLIICLAAWPLCASGCSQQEAGIKVTGRVKLDGVPLSGVSLNLFDADKGIGATSLLDGEGKFEMANSLPAGTYVVTVSPPLSPHPMGAEGKPPIPKLPPNLPKKVMDQRTSDLKANVSATAAVLNLDIVSKDLGRK